MRNRYRRTSVSQYVVVSVTILAVIALGFLSSMVMRRVPFDDYFVIPWSAGRAWLLQGVSPYAAEVTDVASRALASSSYLGQLPTQSVFIDPVLNLIFYLPFSLIPYEISRAIWVALLAILIGVIGYFALQLAKWKLSIFEKMGMIGFLLIWMPGVRTILLGQITPIVILLLLGATVAILNRQDTLAGFLLALTMGSLPTSFLIILLVIILSISQRRWPILIAFFSGVTFLIVVTLLVLPSWLLDWLGVLVNTIEGWRWVQTPLMGLAQLLPGVESYFSIALHAGLGVFLIALLITIWSASGRALSWRISVLLVVAYLLHPLSSIAQLFLLAPAVYLVFRYAVERWGIIGRISAWVLILVLTVGSWFLIAPTSLFVSDVRPLLLLTGLPLFVFLGMIWIRWWALTIPRLSF